MEKKNHLFDESIRQKIGEIKEEQVQEEKKAKPVNIVALIIAGVFALSILLRLLM